MRNYPRECNFFMEGEKIPLEYVLEKMEQIGKQVLKEEPFYQVLSGRYGELYCDEEQEIEVMTCLSRNFPGTRFIFEFFDEEADQAIRNQYLAGKYIRQEGVLIFPDFSEEEWKKKAERGQTEKEYIASNLFFGINGGEQKGKYDLRDVAGVRIGVISEEEWNRLYDRKTQQEAAEMLCKMGLLYSQERISYETFFDRIWKESGAQGKSCHALLRNIPKEFKKVYVQQYPDLCRIGDGIYQIKQREEDSKGRCYEEA